MAFSGSVFSGLDYRLKELVPLPPPMKKREQFVAFVRKYPELFHVESRTMNNGGGEKYVRLNDGGDIPIWI